MDEGREVCRCCDGVGLMMGCDSDGLVIGCDSDGLVIGCDSDGLVDCDCWEIGWDGCWGVL